VLKRARSSFLEVRHDGHLAQDLIPTRVLAQRMLVCNNPESVQQAFIDHYATFERKSPQMRHALEPLLGDGLFISDGLVWKECRRQIAQATHQSRLHLLAPVMTEIATERRAAGWDDLANLPYICAVVDGTLRLYPVPLLAREAQASATIAGHGCGRAGWWWRIGCCTCIAGYGTARTTSPGTLPARRPGAAAARLRIVQPRPAGLHRHGLRAGRGGDRAGDAAAEFPAAADAGRAGIPVCRRPCGRAKPYQRCWNTVPATTVCVHD
jgi:hypothetical protein